MDDAALSDAAKLALDSPVVTRAVALSRWIAESGRRPLTPRQVLRKPDIPVAAAVIGVAPPENPRTAADVLALNRPWNLALDTGLLRADGGTVTAGPALATWPPGDPDILAAWLDGLLTVSGSETGSPWDDTRATDILVFLTAVQEAADGVPLRDQLIKQAAELAERVGLDATFFWPEKRIANTTERLASFGAIGGGEVTSLGRWAAARHLVIQALYGWDGDHLHAFRVRRVTYSDPSFSLEETRDEYAMRVLTALNAGGGKITYEYDFGAGWIHEIALQEKVPREPGAGYPFCLKYSGYSPVEYPDYDSEGEQQPEPSGPSRPRLATRTAPAEITVCQSLAP